MKHLIFLFDGTWNSAATGRFEDATNIFRLNQALSRKDHEGNPQISFYIPGPGNRGHLDHGVGGLFGQGIDQIVREAYVSLSSNYESGDQVYLFGFSRGAIAARALSCLIADSGLLKATEVHRLEIAWNRFVSLTKKREDHAGLEDLSMYVHEGLRIKFVGLYDSVFGRDARRPGRFVKLVFRNNIISPIVNIGIQFLSVDESRRVFSPLAWDGHRVGQIVEQVWVPGTHGDIGGSGRPSFLGMCTLLSMLSKVKEYTQLKTNDDFVKACISYLTTTDMIKIKNERRGFMMRLLSFSLRQPISKSEKSHYLLYLLHNNSINVREKKRLYNFPHLDAFVKLNQYEDCFQQLVAEQVSRILPLI